ncbi:NAD(P)-binding Rossmann-fold superfamily protein [Rhynchospora pubera]|uniref:NAD(P)-binding Rossmann-fold superfamily protein n=1 Tax=Rhynchospora pubera TaxID=906938 RepID=A0AAV8BWU9_9POAL|nr:NAD(P)-binding Rossmann-fold superfamily protein [Rhynchospora pubera]
MAGVSSLSTHTTATRRLEGKVALITGGASGIGKATAKLFEQHGARVVIADIQDELGHTLCNEIGGSSVCSYVHCDVTDESAVKHAIDATIGSYGKLDIMVNNAGTVGSPEIKIIESDKDNFEKVMSVNVTGCYLGTKHAARVMIPARCGSIISMASVASVDPCATPVAYTCSKHAILGIMRSAAIELGQFGIRVNCVSPYASGTPLSAKGFGMSEEEVDNIMAEHAVLRGVRLKADDVAEAVMYLASDESRYISGLNLLVDGAFSVGNLSHGFFKYAQ